MTGVELEIFRRGDEIVLREMAGGLEQAFDLIGDLPDFDREDGPAQERGDLSRCPVDRLDFEWTQGRACLARRGDDKTHRTDARFRRDAARAAPELGKTCPASYQLVSTAPLKVFSM